MREYQTEFECLANRVTGWPEKALVGCFIGGLKDEIAVEIKIFKPDKVNAAIGLARMLEEELQRLRRTMRSSYRSSPPPQISQAAPRANFPFKKLTWAEMQAHREKGLCYNCDKKFGPGHKCKTQQIFLLEADAEIDEIIDERTRENQVDEEDKDETPAVSIHALSGYASPQTMRVSGRIK